MVYPTYIDALFIAVYALSLAWMVVIVAIMLERRRPAPLLIENNHSADQTQEVPVMRAVPLFDVQPPANPTEAMRVRPSNRWQFPARAGTPDQVVIHIEPDGTPTPDQRNIQRIIHHLQNMPTPTAE